MHTPAFTLHAEDVTQELTKLSLETFADRAHSNIEV